MGKRAGVLAEESHAVIFHFNFSNYFKMLRLAWREDLLAVRCYFLAVLLLWVPPVSLFHAVCFFLDGILFPQMLRVKIEKPVFMVGHARSGTTLAHRLLLADEDRFSAFMLYELYFPSLLQKKVIRALAALDRHYLSGFLEKRVQAWEARHYRSDAHEMGLTIPEEDDIVNYYSMASGFWMTKMPYMADLDFYHVDDWPQRKRERLFRFYSDCIRRELYLNGVEKTHLSKNPTFSGRVGSLLEFFPDARIVVNVRDPNETIPSLLKLLSRGYRQLGWSVDRQLESLRAMADISYDTYRDPFDVLEAHPDVPASVIDYRELVSDPLAAVEKMYNDLELPMTDAYRALLAKEKKRAAEHSTTHTYSLDEFGLDRDEIHTRLAPLFERFGWVNPKTAPAEADV